MSHIADGTLHAYLDGGLEHDAPSDAEEIRAHLESCPACRARLDEAARVRERASALLAGGAPDVSSPPPLEELRRRARAPDPAAGTARRRGLGPSARLGWAASIVLAVGAGWMLRDVPGGDPTGDRAAAPPTEVADAAPGAPSAPESAALEDVPPPPIARPATPVVPGGEDAVRVARATGAEAGTGPAAPNRKAAPALEADRAAEEREVPEVPGLALDASVVTDVPGDLERRTVEARSGPPAPPPSSSAALRVPERLEPASVLVQRPASSDDEDDLRAGRGADAAAAERVAPVHPLTGLSPFRRSDRGERERARREAGEEARRPPLEFRFEAAPSPLDVLTVPGVPIRHVEVSELAPGVLGVRALQLLREGTLDLSFVGLAGFRGERTPAQVDASAAEVDRLHRRTLPDGWHQVLVRFGEGWVVARGPVSEARLRELVAAVPVP